MAIEGLRMPDGFFDDQLKTLNNPEVKQAEKEKQRPKRTFTFPELWTLKDEEQTFLIPDLIPDATVTTLIGEDGIGKTQILTQLCLCIALGEKDFLGLPLTYKHGNCLIVATEDSREKFSKAIGKQALAMRPNGLDPEKVGIHFTEAADFDTLEAFMEELVINLKKRPHDLVIIDALSDLFALIDGEINSNTHARKILNHLQNISNEYKATIIIIHHAAKTKIVELQKNGTIFINKNTSQGAGAITQKPRTILAISHDPQSLSEDGKFYTNFLHVVKANLMGKIYTKHALELEFNGHTLLHSYKGVMDIDLYERERTGQAAAQYLASTANRDEKALLAGVTPPKPPKPTAFDLMRDKIFDGKTGGLSYNDIKYEIIRQTNAPQGADDTLQILIKKQLVFIADDGNYYNSNEAPF